MSNGSSSSGGGGAGMGRAGVLVLGAIAGVIGTIVILTGGHAFTGTD